MYTIIIALLIVLYYLKKYMNGGTCTSKKKLFGKTVIVTGATAGIGKETARDLANRGARVILAVRNLERTKEVIEDIAESTGNSDIRAIYLDLTSLESVEKFVREFKNQEDRLDILVNNAGIAYLDHSITVDGFDLTWQTNYLSHFLLTLLLLDLMKKSSPSRIVNVSSKACEFVKNIDFNVCREAAKSMSRLELYSQSKYAQVLFTKKLASLLKEHDVTVYALHPGAVRTNIFDNIGVIDKYFIFTVLNSTVMRFFGKDVRQGAQTSIYCAVQAGIEKYSGEYFADCKHVKMREGRFPQDQVEELWKRSLDMIKKFDHKM